MPAPPLTYRVRAALLAYLGYDPGPIMLLPDRDHPAIPVACRVQVPDFPTDFLVHPPYTAEQVEEVTFTTWPPQPRRD